MMKNYSGLRFVGIIILLLAIACDIIKTPEIPLNKKEVTTFEVFLDTAIYKDLNISGLLYGNKDSLIIRSNGITFHVDSTLTIKNYKVVKIEGVYFKGNNKHINDNQQLISFYAPADTASKGSSISLKDITISGVADGGLLVRGQYWKPKPIDTLSYFETISLDNVTCADYRTYGISVMSIKSKVFANNVTSLPSKKSVSFIASKGVSFTTDLRHRNFGMKIHIDTMKMMFANSNFLYMQNPYSYSVNYIHSDSALYNQDGSNSFVPKTGFAFIKLKSFYNANPDRKFKIDNVIYTNTNNIGKEGVWVDSTSAGIYRNGLRIEGMHNLTIGLLDLDIPFSIGTGGFIGKKPYKSEVPFGTIKANKIISRRFITGHATMISDIICDTLASYQNSLIHQRNSDVNFSKGNIKVILERHND